MAKYKNREVSVVEEIPHAQGDMVRIEHKELVGQSEIVPKNQVILTKAEKNAKDEEHKAKEAKTDPNDYKVEGDGTPMVLQTTQEVLEQKKLEAPVHTHTQPHTEESKVKGKK